MKLPKVDGIEVLRRLKSDERTKDDPGRRLDLLRRRSGTSRPPTSLGVNSYVTKPIKFEEFAKVVAELGCTGCC